jgi:nicotinate-nucleotide pyrophosphorylase (carboxylating)
MIPINQYLIDGFIKQALQEDMPHGHDLTTALTVPSDKVVKAVLNTRQTGIIAGVEIVVRVFEILDPSIQITINKNSGDKVDKNDVIISLKGSAHTIFKGERVALNILSHLSSIATLAHRFVEKTKGTTARITCTRKTLPGLRIFQKFAVQCGGGYPHRYGLDDAIMIKDNHIAATGGIQNALDAANQNKSHMKIIEIEVDTLEQLRQVLDHGGAHCVLLDNMDIKTLTQAVEMVGDKMITEASGGINIDTVADIASTGVGYISVGALTHSAPILDIGLDLEIQS